MLLLEPGSGAWLGSQPRGWCRSRSQPLDIRFFANEVLTQSTDYIKCDTPEEGSLFDNPSWRPLSDIASIKLRHGIASALHLSRQLSNQWVRRRKQWRKDGLVLELRVYLQLCY